MVERDGLFADWMRQHGVSAAIVRPDRYVFGAAHSAEQLNMLVERLIDGLGARSFAPQEPRIIS